MRTSSIQGRLVLALAVAGVGALVGLWIGLRREERAQDLDGTEIVRAAEDSRGELAEESLEVVTDEGTRSEVVVVAQRAEPATARPARPGEGREWSGSVVFEGPDGAREVESAPRYGVLHLRFGGVGGEREQVSCEVLRSEWSCELPFVAEDTTEIVIEGLVAGNRMWRVHPDGERLRVDLAQPPVIRLRQAPPPRLRVLDARTGEPLARFRAKLANEGGLEKLRGFGRKWGHEFDHQPLELHPQTAGEVHPADGLAVLVAAEGYVATSVPIEFGSGETHVVRLARGGSAEVRWTPVSDPLWLRFDSGRGSLSLAVDPVEGTGAWRAGERHVRWQPVDERNHIEPRHSNDLRNPPALLVPVDGLPAGEHRAVLLHRSNLLSESTEVAVASFRVKVGVRSDVWLEEVPGATELDRPLQIEFTLPPQFGSSTGARVLLQRRLKNEWGEEASLKLVEGSWRSETVSARPGKFLATVRGPCTFSQEFEFVEGAGPLVVLPPPELLQRVVVRVSNAVPGEAPPSEKLLWRRLAEPGRTFVALPLAEPPIVHEFGSDQFPCEVRFSAESQFELMDGPWVKLERGGESSISCVEKPRVRLRFQTDGTEVTVPLLMSVHFNTSPRGQENALQDRVRVGTFRPNELRVWFPEPGTYELVFRKLRDFEPLPPLRVNIGARHDQLIELPLIRKR